MPKKYIVRLTDAEREMLHASDQTAPSGGAARCCEPTCCSRIRMRDGPHWTDAAIANAFDCRTQTIENIRAHFVTEGVEIAATWPTEAPQAWEGARREARSQDHCLAAGATHRPGSPTGRSACSRHKPWRWSSVESVSHETLRRTLKKTILRPGRSNTGSFRRPPMPSSQRVWRKCWRSMPNPTMRGIRCSAWMS